MTGPTEDGIIIERQVAAAPASVFSALTTPESFARWFGGAAAQISLDTLDYQVVAGRTWSATMVLPDQNTIDWIGEFLEVSPPSKIVMTITDQPGDSERAELSFELLPKGAETKLQMTQQTPGFTLEQQNATIAGWHAFLDVLAEIAEAK